jgi:hypothetical protein
MKERSMFFASMFTAENAERFKRWSDAHVKAWQECKDAGENLPSGHCFCEVCQGYYINVLKRLPQEFGGYKSNGDGGSAI